jgi:hypothetical protein
MPYKNEGRGPYLPSFFMAEQIKYRARKSLVRQKDGRKKIAKIDNILTNKKSFF